MFRIIRMCILLPAARCEFLATRPIGLGRIIVSDLYLPPQVPFPNSQGLHSMTGIW